MAAETEYNTAWEALFLKRFELHSRRSDLEAQLSDVNNQIAHLREVMAHLGPLVGLPDGESITALGITDAVRWVLKNSEDRLSPNEVRDMLAQKDYDLSNLTAPMGSIYKILSRLSSDNNRPEVLREKDEDGKVYYKWKREEVGITDDDIPF
jgi:hypothetical protein